MNEDAIVNCLLSKRWSRGFCMPRYTPGDWWECDLFEKTAAGYFREYEVKLTVADFRRDRLKARAVRGSGRWTPVSCPKFPGQETYVTDNELKHDRLAAADPLGPSAFFYVTPAGLLNDEPLPPWAGWIEVEAKFDGYRTQLYETLRVEAPQIHRIKLEPQAEHAMTTAYYRLHRFGRQLELPVDETIVAI
jgi:hypothetical protein